MRVTHRPDRCEPAHGSTRAVRSIIKQRSTLQPQIRTPLRLVGCEEGLKLTHGESSQSASASRDASASGRAAFLSHHLSLEQTVHLTRPCCSDPQRTYLCGIRYHFACTLQKKKLLMISSDQEVRSGENSSTPEHRLEVYACPELRCIGFLRY